MCIVDAFLRDARIHIDVHSIYPQIAPESPGDLFDAIEIDEILTLRVLSMTDQQKREMASVDDRSRALLERAEKLANAKDIRRYIELRSM